MTRVRGDDGNALVEFTYLAVLLMVPLVYVMLTVFQVQKAAFGATEAARQASRAYARSADPQDGVERGSAAAALALADQGITDAPDPSFACTGGECLTPGSRVTVTVTYRVTLPVLGLVFGASGGSIPVTARHTEYVDRFTAR